MVTSDNGDGSRPRGGRGRFVRSAATAERDAEACRLRSRGHTYEHIARELGFRHRDLARRAVERALLAIVAEPAAEVRALELARLDMLWRRALEVLERNHLTVSGGKIITIADHQGEEHPLYDDGPVLQAIDRMLRIQARRAALLGLDAPKKVETITLDALDAEIQRLSAELGETSPAADPP